MKDEQRVFVRGVEGRGDEVRQALINLGGKNVHDFYYGDSEGFFYIAHDGEIRFAQESSEIGKIIIDNYRELHLPEQWHDGDVIAYVGNPQKFAVCAGVEDNQYGEVMTRFVVDEERLEMRASVKKIDYNLASPTGKLRFASLLHCHGKDWNAEKKQLVDWKWKPKAGEDYFFYFQ